MTKFAKVLNKISKQIYDRNLRRTKMDTDICGRPLVPGTEAYNYAERTGMIHYEDAFYVWDPNVCHDFYGDTLDEIKSDIDNFLDKK